MEQLLTVPELSQYLKVSVSTIYQWTHLNFVPHMKIGDSVRFKPTEIERWMDKRRVVGRPKKAQEIVS